VDGSQKASPLATPLVGLVLFLAISGAAIAQFTEFSAPVIGISNSGR
jgi:hypothetical protein